MKSHSLSKLFFVVASLISIIISCKWEKPELASEAALTCADYPDDVRAILVTKCATPGCHNSKSYEAASGLDLTNWQTMKKGNVAGAVVVPGNVDYSTLFTYCNTYPDLGFTLQLPKMPVNATVLSHDEMVTLRNWINNGAANRCGELMFPFDASRRKFVVANQACDLAQVFDIHSRSAMKVFEVGHTSGATPPESPHQIKYTPDGKYYLIGFYSSLLDTSATSFGSKIYVQRYDAATDQLVDEVELNKAPNGTQIGGRWGTVAISPDSKKAYAVDYDNHRVALINLDGAMTVFTTLPINISSPHGVAVNKDGSKLYITDQDGGKLYITSSTIPGLYSPDTVSLQGGSRGHEIIFSPDYSKYFVTCEAPPEVRVFNTNDNSLAGVIPVGALPQEFAISINKPYLFVSCTDDPFINAQGKPDKGSVYIIDYNTLAVYPKVRTGTQPHGLAVDDVEGVVYVANRNNEGSTTHHLNVCGNRNGYLTIIDMNTLQLVPGYKYELGVNPYAVAVKP